jgi:hypothetical protein
MMLCTFNFGGDWVFIFISRIIDFSWSFVFPLSMHTFSWKVVNSLHSIQTLLAWIFKKKVIFLYTQQFFSYMVASSFQWGKRELISNVPKKKPPTFRGWTCKLFHTLILDPARDSNHVQNLVIFMSVLLNYSAKENTLYKITKCQKSLKIMIILQGAQIHYFSSPTLPTGSIYPVRPVQV